MHYVMARITVQPEAVAATLKLFQALVPPTRQEPGCVAYEVFQQQPAPHVFQTLETWRSEADAQSHMQTPHVAAAFAAAGALLAAPPEIVAWTKL